MSEISVEDIRKAIDSLKESQNVEPQKKVIYHWGWIKVGEDGLPAEVGLNKNMKKKVQEFAESLNNKKMKTKVKTIFGVSIVSSKLIESRIVDKKAQGKKNRKSGAKFELLVRKDLESKGWICAKWTNNVELPYVEEENFEEPILHSGKLIAAKRKFNPFSKALSLGTGFPDFICYKIIGIDGGLKQLFDVRGVEAKSNGYLDKDEKEKCEWLLDNNIFSDIIIAKKGKKGEIIYNEFIQP